MRRLVAFVAALLLMATRVTAQETGPVWPKLSEAQHAEVMRFGDEFKQFIGRAKSDNFITNLYR